MILAFRCGTIPETLLEEEGLEEEAIGDLLILATTGEMSPGEGEGIDGACGRTIRHDRATREKGRTYCPDCGPPGPVDSSWSHSWPLDHS